MRSAVIVDAVRTPIGKRNGVLKSWHPVDLSSLMIGALIERNDLDSRLIDDVLWGCVGQAGEQSTNLGRNAVLAAGLPEEVPGVTIDRQCGSSQQALHFAAQGVMAGVYDVIIAGGVEMMSRIPMGIGFEQGPGHPYSPRLIERYDNGLVPQGLSAELIAERWSLRRSELDRLALDSHLRAARATDEGRFESQIVPVDVVLEDGSTATVTQDEGIRRTTSLEALAGLKPAFKADGVVTAGNSSQISDGAAAVLVMGEDVAERMGVRPLAKVTHFSVVGVDPVIMLTGPIPATVAVLERAGSSVDEVDLFEVNEAFASVIGAWLAETGADWQKVNVNGGAIAVGHPLGGSGAVLTTRLVHEMRRSGARIALQTMCEGGGTGNATVFELLD
jgi:acetyl-CoA acyltransferase